MATHHHQIARPAVQTVATTTAIHQDQTVALRQDEYAMGFASLLSFIIPLQIVLLFIFRERMRASSSILAKIGLAIFWIQKIALAIAFWPITLIYLKGRCWNCKKWGHHARYCPEHFRCWSCGQLGHLSHNCPNCVRDPRYVVLKGRRFIINGNS